MDEFSQILLGLAFLGFLVLFVISYISWQIVIGKKKVKRATAEDIKLIANYEGDDNKVIHEIKSEVIPSLVHALSMLAGISLAAMFIVITIRITGEAEFEGSESVVVLKEGILYAALAMVSICTILWLVTIEQLILMKSPSIDTDKFLKLHKNNYNNILFCWFVIISSVYLFLVLAQPYIAIFAGILATTAALRCWIIQNEWDKDKREEVKASVKEVANTGENL